MPISHEDEHEIRIQIALLKAFHEIGLRDVEKRARDIYLEDLSKRIDTYNRKMRRIATLWRNATPKAEDGYVDCDVIKPLIDEEFETDSERIQFCALAYFTRAGKSLQFISNPVIRFNDEFKKSCDHNGQLRSNSRMGAISANKFNAEKKHAEELSEIWVSSNTRSPSQLTIAALTTYGTVFPQMFQGKTDDDIYGDDDKSPARLKVRPEDLIFTIGSKILYNHYYDRALVSAFVDHPKKFRKDTENFIVCDDALLGAGGEKFLFKTDYNPFEDMRTYKAIVYGGVTWGVSNRYLEFLANANLKEIAGGVVDLSLTEFVRRSNN